MFTASEEPLRSTASKIERRSPLSGYTSKGDLEEKADWEGGPAEFIFGYGLKPGELPDGTPETVRQAVTRLADQAAADLETFRAWLYAPAEDAGAHGQADPQQAASDEEGSASA
jgi:hypothetical protein